ncbi:MULTISPECIES: sensor histidine kinase [Streptomyces]|uniref:Histidine kinase-, DNA gyrase B-, and HSP90-like ATPase n=2 Tax=Streptomyces TaxID=1883 RepID=A0A1I6T3E4_9ACTN|nr:MULTISPECIES: GAF domain-containing protein [Streptomyces]SFS83765.1 Histidine kinase-, DNA gyrase B-, and HSP90-like ATPase [Streptomyces harbinensis]
MTPQAPAGPPPPLSPELARRMPRLLDAMSSLGAGTELPTLLDRIVTTAADLAGARYAALAVLSDDGERIGEFAAHGTDPGTLGRAPLLAELLEHGGRPRPTREPGGVLAVPIRVHGAGFGGLYLAETHDGHPFTDEDRRMLDILATEAGIAIGNARLYEAVRQQARWMDGSVELSASLLAEDVDNALAVVAEQARRLADADAGLVLVPTGDADNLEVVAASITPGGPPLIGTALPADADTVRQLLSGEPVFIEDTATDPRLTTRRFAEHFGPCMLLPLTSGDRTLGALGLPRAPGGDPYSVPERAMATQFAQQAALALVLAQARADRESLAVYEDRDRIGRDLHDLVIQRLFAVGMLLEGARRALPEATGTGRDGDRDRNGRSNGNGVADRIGKAVTELDATIQEIRTTVFALQQQPDEAQAGLRTRVLRETGTAAQSLGFAPSVSFTGPVDTRVAEGVARNLVAALREALSNAARHARAGRVEVTVDATAALPDGREAVRLTVADDGVGLPEEGAGRRSGLRNLADRAAELGGYSELGPGLGGSGLKMIWHVPL